jgi:uncharacterized repeat protein (TIGR01451 family)
MRQLYQVGQVAFRVFLVLLFFSTTIVPTPASAAELAKFIKSNYPGTDPTIEAATGEEEILSSTIDVLSETASYPAYSDVPYYDGDLPTDPHGEHPVKETPPGRGLKTGLNLSLQITPALAKPGDLLSVTATIANTSNSTAVFLEYIDQLPVGLTLAPNQENHIQYDPSSQTIKVIVERLEGQQTLHN